MVSANDSDDKLGNRTCVTEEYVSDPVATGGVVTILTCLSSLIMVTNVIILVKVIPSKANWYAKFQCTTTAGIHVFIGFVLGLGAVQAVYLAHPLFVGPTICLSVQNLQLMTITAYVLTGAVHSYVNMRSIQNALRIEEKSFKRSSVALMICAWVSADLYFSLLTIAIMNVTDFHEKLCKKKVCSLHMYPDNFLQVTIYGVMGGVQMFCAVLNLRLVCIAKRHARQIDAQHNAVRAMQGPNSVTTKIESKKQKINKCLLKALPHMFLWAIIPSLMLFNVNCHGCLSPVWEGCIWLAPFGLGVLFYTRDLWVKRISTMNLKKKQVLFCCGEKTLKPNLESDHTNFTVS